MPLAALILSNDCEEGRDLPLLLPVAGQTLLEFHARTLNARGVGHIVLLVDRLPSALLSALDRLKSAGIGVDVVRSASQAADSIHPDERLIVVSGRLVFPPAHYDVLTAEDAGLCLLTVPDKPEFQHFERIGPQSRWTGIALLNGQLLRETAAMLGDWELGPTLLRVAVQKNVRQTAAAHAERISMPATIAEAAQAGAALAASVAPTGLDWVDRLVVAPASARLAGLAMKRMLSVTLLGVVAGVMGIAAFGLAVFGVEWAGFLLYLLAAIPIAMGEILDQVGARGSRLLHHVKRWRVPNLALLIVVSAGVLLFDKINPVLAVLALWCASALLLSEQLRGKSVAPAWLAGPHAVALILILAFAAGYCAAGLGIATAYLLAAQYWRQRNMNAA